MVWPPAPLQVATVRGHWVNPVTGADLIGTAKLTALGAAVSPAGDLLFTQQPAAQSLVNGAVEWPQVLLTDSAGLAEPILYRLQVTSANWSDDRVIQLLVAQVSGGVIRLDDVAIAVAGPQVTTYLLAASRGAAGGVAPLGSDGLVPASYLPASGGGVPATRHVDSGTGLSGGGDLTVDRTLAVVFGSTAGTACQGNDGRLSDPRTPLAHAHSESDVTGLIAALAALDGRIGALEASPGGGSGWDPAMENLVAATADPLSFRSGTPLGAAGWAVRVKIPAGKAINGFGANVSSAGTLGAGGTNGFAFKADDGTLVASTPDDNNLWTVSGKRTKNLAAPIAAQGALRYGYLAIRVSGYSVGPGFDFIDGTGSGARLDGLNQTHKRSITLGGSVWANLD